MSHETPLISTIVGGFVLAFIFGAVAHRFRIPPLVGYLFAGIVVGPHTPGYVADQNLAPELAEIGVILLMFGVGLHFSLKDLLSVRGIAVPGALAQIGFATLMGLALAKLLGWSTGGGLVFGLALSVASTVVLLKALQERRLLETERGKVAVGWLIVEDLAMVLALVLIPAAASLSDSAALPREPLAAMISAQLGIQLGISGIIGLTLLKIVAFVGLMLVVGRRIIPWILHWIAHTGSRELFRLGVLAIALGVAMGSAKLFGVSLALGAFFAGMILSESELSHRAAQESLPLRDAFSVLFFVSVGTLFDPQILFQHPLPVLGTVFIIIVGKSMVAFVGVILFRNSVSTALTISASLAQIGEFSFILAELGTSLKLIPEIGRDLILAGAILSILLNPAIFSLCERIRPALELRFPHKPTHDEPEEINVESSDDAPPTSLTNHIILVGYGRVGALVGADLLASQTPFLVIEDSDTHAEALKTAGIELIRGNAANPEALERANPAGARSLVVAIPDPFEAGQAIAQGRKLNPDLRIIARTQSAAEAEHLIRLGADQVFNGEREIALKIVEALKSDEPITPAPCSICP